MPDFSGLTDLRERELLMMLASFPDVFVDSVNELKPGSITAYANILADKFNSFYAALPVIKAETDGLAGARLKLVDAVRIVLRNALSLLGIKAPERM
jgi:arginyl-tRNA synthetase